VQGAEGGKDLGASRVRVTSDVQANALGASKYNKRKGSFANTDDIELFSEKALKKMLLEFADA
jgi:hypothetical protein